MPTIDNEKKKRKTNCHRLSSLCVCVLWQTVAFVVVLPVDFFQSIATVNSNNDCSSSKSYYINDCKL